MQAHVGVAKAGVDALSNSVAIEFGPRGITSNVIAPGPIAGTEGMERLARKEDAAAGKKQIPAGRWGTVREIADATVYLFSEAAGYVNGTTLVGKSGYSNFVCLVSWRLCARFSLVCGLLLHLSYKSFVFVFFLIFLFSSSTHKNDRNRRENDQDPNKLVWQLMVGHGGRNRRMEAQASSIQTSSSVMRWFRGSKGPKNRSYEQRRGCVLGLGRN